MNKDFILEAKGLGVSFGGVHALKSIDFNLRKGELKCLIGPNGAGKTTFFRLLSGQHTQTRGEIVFQGQKISGMLPYQIARLGIGVKTQVPSLFEGLTVQQNLALAARRVLSNKPANRAVEHVLERISLAAERDTPARDLAHGQRQWVELGMVLVLQPALALLDEPAAGMTHAESLKTIDIIKQITSTSAVVVVEHDMDFIKLIGESVTVFDRGEIIAEGPFKTIAKDARVRAAYLGRKDVNDA